MKYAIACKSAHFWHQLNEISPELINNASCIFKSPDDLFLLSKKDIDLIFFPHWSWVVPDEYIEEFICICFHSTPLPYGRGGSPIQNMVLNQHKATQVVALKMTKQLDAGPVYLRKEVSLLGGGEEVFRRIYKTIISMMNSLLVELPIPQPQDGDVVIFKRRRKEQSRLDMNYNIEYIFDQIRILDVDGYPPAYIDIGDYRLTFSHPSMRLSGYIDAHVRIQKKTST
ncbi:methionyl-tRNA formyltransferase [Aeromonas veronii]|uniref:methionyl-tRNA formyltransferase n=1 Tax=Aeromonas veronii TaxID=654 RepID=UPI00191E625F|nr:methionyl-tRNA formyltransferase [Aeromonas veronii]MBL0446934.1 methionyl-tRNA formyltransferase [Aeromonas veronii]